MNYASFDDVKQIVTGMAKKIPHGVMLGNAPVGHIEWQMYLQRDYLKLDGTPLANASNDYDELLKFAQDNSLIISDTTDKSLFKYDSGTDVLTLPDYDTDKDIDLIPQIKYIKGTTVWEELDFNKLMPIGTVINFMGTTAPEYYLACDGTIYNILDYSALANFFEVQFGSVNFFGGDGTTTFAVPDLRGEFLRGTGTNSHTNQGSGDSVGTHQDGTGLMRPIGAFNSNYGYVYNTTSLSVGASNADKLYKTSGNSAFSIITHTTDTGSWIYNENTRFTSRPTNTSVLYCIKYK